MNFEDELMVAGEKLRELMVARIDSNVPPPNAPATVRRKGHGLTLRDTFAYRESIECRTGESFVEVGVFDPDVARYVFYNEHGTSRIPPRPVFGPVFDGPGQKVIEELEAAIADMFLREI